MTDILVSACHRVHLANSFRLPAAFLAGFLLNRSVPC
jgi:hypothetical protein